MVTISIRQRSILKRVVDSLKQSKTCLLVVLHYLYRRPISEVTLRSSDTPIVACLFHCICVVLEVRVAITRVETYTFASKGMGKIVLSNHIAGKI